MRRSERETAWNHAPDCRSGDDADEQDPAPAEGVARRKHEDVFEEKRVQFCQLWVKKK